MSCVTVANKTPTARKKNILCARRTYTEGKNSNFAVYVCVFGFLYAFKRVYANTFNAMIIEVFINIHAISIAAHNGIYFTLIHVVNHEMAQSTIQ